MYVYVYVYVYVRSCIRYATYECIVIDIAAVFNRYCFRPTRKRENARAVTFFLSLTAQLVRKGFVAATNLLSNLVLVINQSIITTR